MIYRDRRDAGRQLALKLKHYADDSSVLVLALPRGGVPVAYEVAAALHVPWDIFLVRKLGVPDQPELAMGAIASGGIRVLNEEVVRLLGIPDEVIDQVAAEEQEELQRRELAYRDGRPAPAIKGRTIILVDDGLATGSSMRAVIAALRQQRPRGIVVAVPVAAATTCEEFKAEVDDIVCAATPEPFRAVGLWYQDFSQITDDEMQELMQESATSPR
jgi:putative phosphoribosyl transferase